MARSRARSIVLWTLVGLAALVVLGGAGVASLAYLALVADLPDLRNLEDYRPPLTSVVLDRSGRPIGEFYEERRRLVDLDELPPHVVQAFIAAEDKTFFEHSGVDYASIVRAAWTNLRAGGEIRQGASTITQQLVKSMLLSPERTLRRKLREMLLARRIEQRFAKQEILHLYLNQIYFGSGAYGVAEAARTYFGKDVREIDVGEAALIAALPKAPTRFSPYRNPTRAEERRRYVLARLREEGAIDVATEMRASANPPALRRPPEYDDYELAAYFTEEVRRKLFETLGGERVLRGGLVIETTLDLELQRTAVAALRAGLEALDHRQGYRGPVRRVEPGAVEEEIARLAEENQLVAASADAEEEDAEAAARSAAAPAAPPTDRPLLAVVTRVDERANLARVAFAPGLAAAVRVEDVAWARPFNTESAPWQIQKIATAFHVGDVVRLKSYRPVAKEGEPEPGTRWTLDQKPLVQGALLSLEIESGEVLALVGGYDFADSEFDRAVQAERQPGSSFKPFVYAAALGRGFTPTSILHDRPVVMEDGSGKTWRPQNYSRRFLGPITMREALARSVNNATIHLMRDVGVESVIEMARRLGVRALLEPNLSLALGSYPVTLLEITRAYGVFAKGGRPVEARFVRGAKDPGGALLLEALTLEPPSGAVAAGAASAPDELGGLPPRAAGSAPPAGGAPAPPADADGRVIPAAQAYLALDLMRAVIQHPQGTGAKARSLGRPLAGKTGTTNSQADAWFIGFSPDLATGVWVGFDSKEVLGKGETGAKAALPIWIDFMKVALETRPERDFEVPEHIVFARIDPKSGLLAPPGSPDGYFQAFLEGSEPHESAELSADAAEQRRVERLDF
jgi:penicillin-binding protein 1A